jgi:sulfoxide reductase heme-binding subunit YedZ
MNLTAAFKPGSRPFILSLKVLLWPLCLAPLAAMLLGLFAVGGFDLGANPVEELLHRCGKWGLKFLLITLAITPGRWLLRWNWLISFRRLLGLFAFFYIALHFTVYIVLDRQLDLSTVVEDVLERPYITIGMAAFLMLIPLAATSTRGMMRRLGRRWKQLHRLVYVIATLGVWHFYWQVKLDVLEPLLYAGVLAVLLGVRVRRRWPARPAPTVTAANRSRPAGGALRRRG